MESQPTPMTERNSTIADVVSRERKRLGSFIRRRVRDPSDAEDILQDVLHDFVQAYRLPEPIEQVSAWLFRVARNRIIDGFRKKREHALSDMKQAGDVDDDGNELGDDYRLDLILPTANSGPEAAYARTVLLNALYASLERLPAEQRDIFMAHEIEGRSFKALSLESGVSVNTLLSRKRYAVQHLRADLQVLYEALDV